MALISIFCTTKFIKTNKILQVGPLQSNAPVFGI